MVRSLITDADAIIAGAAFDEVGRSVAGVGDLNGDGFDDILIGTDIAGGSFQGQAFLFNGPLSGERDASSADAIITGSFPNESFGASVASAGDVNDDGVQDILVGFAITLGQLGADLGMPAFHFMIRRLADVVQESTSPCH